MTTRLVTTRTGRRMLRLLLLASVLGSLGSCARLGSIQSQQNACPGTSCFCDARQAWCSARRLAKIPADLPADIQTLHFADNLLAVLPEDALKPYPDLLSVNLSRNALFNISHKAFVHNTQLRSLDLSENHLGSGGGLMFLCSFGLGSLESLDVSGNDLQSDFSLVTLCRAPRLRTLSLARNNISAMPAEFLQVFPSLDVLDLARNALVELPEDLSYIQHPLRTLDISYNAVGLVNCSALETLQNLRSLTLAYNDVRRLPQGMCSEYLHHLEHLDLSGNPFSMLPPRSFHNLSVLTDLNLSHLPDLRYLAMDVLGELSGLRSLDLSHGRLEFVHGEAFRGLDSLTRLDLSHCRLTWLHESVLTNLTSLRTVLLAGNPWNCDCDLKWLQRWANAGAVLPQPVICSSPAELAGFDLLNRSVSATILSDCEAPVIVDLNTTLWFAVGSQALIDCDTGESPHAKVTWITPREYVLTHHPAFPDLTGPDSVLAAYHDDHSWHGSRRYQHNLPYDQRMTVLRNGSLFIDYVTRRDAGNYTCFVQNDYGNHTDIIHVRLDFGIFRWVKLFSMLCGLISALSFFFVAMVIIGIRALVFKCSSKERRKRKSIREVINSLHDYKTVQIDRFCAYKTAKINKLHAFKSAKMQKMVAFKTAKVGKMRNYRQVTMASIFHHLEKMKQHYRSQMDKVKDNCSQQVEKLRENYSSQVSKFKDYRAEKIDRIRDNYSNQMLRIKEYRAGQMARLRDQYKVQQQHVFKLMELLDIGNCLNVVEAECMRTESMLFDPNISFDLEAQPVHVTRDLDFSDEDSEYEDSEYMTAGSQTEEGGAAAAARKPGKKKDKCKRKKHRSRSKSLSSSADKLSSSSSLEDDKSDDETYNAVLPPPAPPLDFPLEELLASHLGEFFEDDLSLSSAHQDGRLPALRRGPTIDSDNLSTEYESVQQSRSTSPAPQIDTTAVSITSDDGTTLPAADASTC